MCLKHAPEKASESARFLTHKILLEKISDQTNHIFFERLNSSLPFPAFFDIDIPSLPLISSGKDPFNPLQKHYQNSDFDKAITILLFLLPNDADQDLCYEYLIKLLPLMETISDLFNNLPSFFKRLPEANQMEFALLLGEWYEKKKGYPEAIYCVSKGFTKNKKEALFKRTSQLFSKLILSYLKDQIQHPYFLEKTAEEYYKTLEDMTKLLSTQDEIEELYTLAKEKHNNIPFDEKQNYAAHHQELNRLSEIPFVAPSPITQKYEEALQLFYDHFSKDIVNVRDFQAGGIEHLRKLFQILLEDLFLILGPAPCEYDIRALGGFGREEVLPSLDFECLLLVEDIGNDYFSSLIKIIDVQFLSLGKKIKWQIVDARFDFIPAFIRTTHLNQSSSEL